jgi:hypothetical protein
MHIPSIYLLSFFPGIWLQAHTWFILFIHQLGWAVPGKRLKRVVLTEEILTRVGLDRRDTAGALKTFS